MYFNIFFQHIEKIFLNLRLGLFLICSEVLGKSKPSVLINWVLIKKKCVRQNQMHKTQDGVALYITVIIGGMFASDFLSPQIHTSKSLSSELCEHAFERDLNREFVKSAIFLLVDPDALLDCLE